MKSIKTVCAVLSSALILSSCGTWSNLAKGSVIGGASGAAGGALIGALIGKYTGNTAVGTAVGAAVGTAVGTGTGALIGKRMDNAAEAAALVENATVETITDANNLTAVKVTFDSGVLFATNKYALNKSAKENLAEFAKVLIEYSDADVVIYGHTDSTGNDNINNPLSVNRAMAVAEYLLANGVSEAQIKSVEGFGSTQPVADNSTAAGRAENRRVEIFMYASVEMIEAAGNGTLE
jgi:outer membrane protein OmpA-like peptidoglycan-associated protein